MNNNAIVAYNLYEAQSAYQRLQICLTKDSVEAAILEIRTFLKMFPDVALAHNDLGVLYYRAGNSLLALANYEKANRLQPGTPAIIKNLAEFYFAELGWVDDAIQLLTGLLKEHPLDGEILISLGIISERLSRPDEARSFFRRAHDLAPDNAAILEALVRLDGPVSAAERSASAAAASRPVAPDQTPLPQQARGASVAWRSPDELYREAQEALRAGREVDAIAALERLTGQEPSHALGHNDLGVLYLRRGDYERAGYHHERAVSCNPANVTFRKNLADYYYAVAGKTDEAVDIYTRLLKECPDDVEVLSALALISRANNLNAEARTFILKALDLEPWNAAARQFLSGLGD